MQMVTVGLRHNRNWIRLWVGQAFALFGFYVLNITIVLWVGIVIAADTDWAPAAVSGALICAAAPVLLVGPIAGVYVDRWDRRRTMLVTDMVRAGLIASLVPLAMLGQDLPIIMQLAWIYAVVAAVSVCAQFFQPARFGVVAAIVAPADQSRALSLTQATANTAAILGPPLGAPLLFAAGVEWALLINTAALLVSFVAIRAIRMPASDETGTQTRQPFSSEFRAGVQFFLRNRVLLAMAVSASIAMLGVGALNTLHVFFVEDNLRVDASMLGLLAAAFGAGNVIGALLAAWRGSKWGDARFFWMGLLLAGIALSVYSRLTSLTAALVVMIIAGIPLGASNAVTGPLVLRVTPQHLIGRVMAAMNPSLQAASLVGMAVVGALASGPLAGLDVTAGPLRFGPYDTVFLGSGLAMLVGGVWAARALTGSRVRAASRVDVDQSGEDADSTLPRETSAVDVPESAGSAEAAAPEDQYGKQEKRGT